MFLGDIKFVTHSVYYCVNSFHYKELLFGEFVVYVINSAKLVLPCLLYDVLFDFIPRTFFVFPRSIKINLFLNLFRDSLLCLSKVAIIL